MPPAPGTWVAEFSQFTPQQVLEAGHRAEVDGQRTYAAQFYTYVLTHNPGTLEAGEAAEAMRRLETTPDEGSQTPPFAPASTKHPGPYAVPLGPAQSAAPPRTDWPLAIRASRTASPVPGSLRRQADAPALRTNNTSRSPRRASKIDHPQRPPSNAKRYRLGRFMATLLGLAGGIGLVGGMVALGAGLVVSVAKESNPLLFMLATGPAAAIAVIASAAVLVLLSQMAQATFDAASRRPDDHDGD